MDKLAHQAYENQDYELLTRLTEDLKAVRQIGIKVGGLRGQLQQAVWADDFKTAVELKEVLKRIESQRDSFDARYETSRYEEMISMPGPTASDERSKQQQEAATMQMDYEIRK